MSACFYHNDGCMVGLDFHTYITIGPKGIPVPIPLTMHGVRVPAFSWPASDATKRTHTVVSVGHPMLKIGFSNTLIIHMPITPLPPHPAEGAELAVIVLFSSSKALLGVASVTGEGGALATCAAGPIGFNPNCGSGVGGVYNPSTVITSPTASDFADFAAEFIFDFLVGEVAKKLVPKGVDEPLPKAYLKKAIKKLLKDTIMVASAAAAAGGT